MITDIVNDMPSPELSILNCISVETVCKISEREIKHVDYLLSEFPRLENSILFSFISNNEFNKETFLFPKNQDNTTILSQQLFDGATSLTSLENEALEIALRKSIKHVPTLKGRK